MFHKQILGMGCGGSACTSSTSWAVQTKLKTRLRFTHAQKDLAKYRNSIGNGFSVDFAPFRLNMVWPQRSFAQPIRAAWKSSTFPQRILAAHSLQRCPVHAVKLKQHSHGVDCALQSAKFPSYQKKQLSDAMDLGLFPTKVKMRGARLLRWCWHNSFKYLVVFPLFSWSKFWTLSSAFITSICIEAVFVDAYSKIAI